MERPELWKHQRDMIAAARPLDNYGIFSDPGTGKSRTVIEIWQQKCIDAHKMLRTLIVAPPIQLDNWAKQFRLYSNIPDSSVTVLGDSGKKRLEAFSRATARGDGHVFVTNYEGLLMAPLFEAIQKWQPEALIFDECHRLANYKSKRSKAADRLANPSTKAKPVGRPLVYVLSGTPVMNNMMDLFHQYKVLDGGEAFGTNFFAFRALYFKDKNAHMNRINYFPNWVPKDGSGELIAEKMKRNSMRARKEDCLDLPPLVDVEVAVELSPAQRRIYDDMLRDYVAFFQRSGEEHAVMATMAMTKGMRLMQIASGFVKTDGGQELSAEEGWTPKQYALAELVEDLRGRKGVIWAVWKHNYKQIREVFEKLGVRWLEMNGDYGPKKNRENAALFESSSEYDWIIAHPESGGEGIDLITASEMVSYSRDFSWRRWEQCSARNYRGGSNIHDKITRYSLVARNTIEEKITKMLVQKKEISDTVLREITLNPGRQL